MSYTIDFGPDRPDQPSPQIATNKGWIDLRDWSEGLDGKEYLHLRQLIEHGWQQDLPATIAELAKALEDDPPKGDVADTAEGLLHVLREHETEGYAAINAGTPNGDVAE